MLPTLHSKAQQTQPQREKSAPNPDLIQIVVGDSGAKDSEDLVDQSYLMLINLHYLRYYLSA